MVGACGGGGADDAAAMLPFVTRFPVEELAVPAMAMVWARERERERVTRAGQQPLVQKRTSGEPLTIELGPKCPF